MITLQITIAEEHLATLAGMIAAAMPTKDDDRPLTVPEAAKRLGVSVRTIQRRVEAGLIERVPGMGRVLIPAAAVQRLLNPNAENAQ
jgi:excisionase family DNA binding protein